jgi:hypothetical protein
MAQPLGLNVETAVIIVLGRQATAGWQTGDPQVVGVTGSSSAVAAEVGHPLAETSTQSLADDGTGRTGVGRTATGAISTSRMPTGGRAPAAHCTTWVMPRCPQPLPRGVVNRQQQCPDLPTVVAAAGPSSLTPCARH